MPIVRDILEAKGTKVSTIHPDQTVLDAAKLMNQQRIGAVMVLEGENISGIFTERDVLNRVVAARQDPATTKIGDVMTTEIACCSLDTKIEACRTAMTKNKIRHLPVVEDGKLHGIISSGDILARELKDQADTIRYLHEYMQGPN
ncbi:MAG: CBS domain-containing protein [Phycisphaerae bacterium]